MPQPCTVCAHPLRADIDRRLAFQVVNVKRLADEVGLKRDAVARHRAKHLPEFLPAFTARASALDVTVLQAEAQRLYSVTLDALAAAEQGVLVEVGEDGLSVRKVSSTAVARLIREARAGLGLLAALAHDGAPAVDSKTTSNDALDQRIADALDRAATRGLPRPTEEVLDVDVLEDEPMFDETNERSTNACSAGAGTPGPGPGRAGGLARIEEGSATDTPPGGSQTGGPEDSAEARLAHIHAVAAERGVTISKAASVEELREQGYDA